MTKPVIILGAGGHAAVIAEILHTMQRNILGVVAPNTVDIRIPLKGLKQFDNDNTISEQFAPAEIELANGIGSLPGSTRQRQIFEYFTALGYRFTSVISPHAIVSKYVELGHGVQIMAGCIIQPGVYVGDNTLLNTACSIDHDCKLGAHNHIAPGATLSGGVTTGNQVHIGTGASIIQNINIGENSVIGAGATVVRDVTEGKTLLPARVRIK